MLATCSMSHSRRSVLVGHGIAFFSGSQQSKNASVTHARTEGRSGRRSFQAVALESWTTRRGGRRSHRGILAGYPLVIVTNAHDAQHRRTVALRLLHAELAHGPFQRADHDLVEELALAEALVDPVLVAGPHGLGGDFGRETIAPDPADHLIRC